jgi:hypothetical protein
MTSKHIPPAKPIPSEKKRGFFSGFLRVIRENLRAIWEGERKKHHRMFGRSE